MKVSLSSRAEQDFLQLSSRQRSVVAKALLGSAQLDLQKIHGLTDLYRIRVGALRLPARRIEDELVVMRVIPPPMANRYFARYRTCKAARDVTARVLLADSVIAAYANGQTPAAMLESLEERLEGKLSHLRGAADALRSDIDSVRESVHFLEFCETESEKNIERKYNELRDELLLTLETIEERVLSLESPQRPGVVIWVHSIIAGLISTCFATWFRSSVKQAQPAQQ